ncbi:T cell receptor beta chain MC.7.G5-like isoform X2 [Myxocyprinus asiaticus]|uniref:T cell receptor beta chain MC.7.G5-like isoform X2 n=1 Tax=Myxocyprinus asiaticus TaxID=70543 RepID=UPI00222370DB|nr:T cell receptor beta chain MC.7.G5-like isoform X2 [Myxocyprinus asiaticus]
MGSAAYFGNGTKLTVLDSNLKVSQPENITVTALSEKEKCKKFITLVCVVMNFYPDHLQINWKIGGKKVAAGVATDNEATKKTNGRFDMSSRLKVSKEKWNKAENIFTCIYSFYNGSEYLTDSSSVNGIKGSGFDRETHIKSAQMIKLGYGVFIAKSGLYGLIILVFVLRQGSTGK